MYEVFEQEDDTEKAEMDEEQYAFEEQLGRDIEEATQLFRRRREEVLDEFRRDDEEQDD